MTSQPPSLDQRVTRLEQILDRLVTVARDYPLGRALLRRLGID